MSEMLDKGFLYIQKNYIRIGVVLLLVGILLMLLAFGSTSSAQSIAASVSGGFLFLSGIILFVNSPVTS